MIPVDPKSWNTLVLTPASCARYNHTRILRRRCGSVVEFNFIETLKQLGLAETKKTISRIISEKKIDVFFISLYGDNFLLSPGFLQSLRQKTKIVLWSWDDDVHFDSHSRHYAPAVDAVVTTDYFSVDAYRKLGVPAVLCFANLPKDMSGGLHPARDIDVSFVGNCAKADRRRYLDFLEENGVKVERFGFGSVNGFLKDEEMLRVFSRSKINLNFSRLEFVDWIHGINLKPARDMGHKARPIEIAMTRSFCLSEYYPALPHVFVPGNEIDVFTDKNSLLDKVRRHLAHDEQRELIASRAHARALREYEDEPAFERIAAELTEAFNRPAPRSRARDDDPAFAERRINDLVVHELSMLPRGRLLDACRVVPELFQYGPSIFLRGAFGGLARSLDILRRKYCNPSA